MTLDAAEAAVAAMTDIRGEILIVDNDSQDGSFEMMKDAVTRQNWPNVSVLQSGRNGGYGAGNNFGIRAGFQAMPDERPDYIYILNSDAFPERHAIAYLLKHMEENAETGFAGSLTIGDDGVAHQTAFRFPTMASEFEGAIKFGPVSRLLREKIVALPVPETTCHVGWLAGASLMIRREILDDIGLFDESFFLYFEETDLCLRAVLNGHKMTYVRESVVTHIGSVSTGMKTQTRMPRYWFDSRLQYFLRNHGRTYTVAATLLHLAGGSFARLREILQRKPASTPKFFLIDMALHGAKAALSGAGRKSRQITDLNGTPILKGEQS
jgi:GT2 family glycosyltransferase